MTTTTTTLRPPSPIDRGHLTVAKEMACGRAALNVPSARGVMAAPKRKSLYRPGSAERGQIR